jgi:hypothetical protein
MNIETFFENLETLFEDEDDISVEINAMVFRKNGKVVELRLFNEKFDDILIVDRKGQTEAINVDEYKVEK